MGKAIILALRDFAFEWDLHCDKVVLVYLGAVSYAAIDLGSFGLLAILIGQVCLVTVSIQFLWVIILKVILFVNIIWVLNVRLNLI